MQFKTSTFAALSFCVFTSLASADGLADKNAQAAEQTRADAKVKAVNDNCGSSIKFTFDWSTWKVASDEHGHHASESCGLALQGIKGMCNGDEPTKAAITKQLKTITCLGNATEAKVDFKDGVLTLHTDLVNAGDLTTLAKKTLKDSLK
jgi:hypothetical protein